MSEKLLLLIEKVEDGEIDEMTFVQTAESMLDDDSRALNPWSFVRSLQRRRDDQLHMVIYPSIRKIGYLSRAIKLVEACFKQIGADKK